MNAIALPQIDRGLFSGSLSRAIADRAGSHSESAIEASFATSVSVDEARRATIQALRDLLIETSEDGWDGYGAAPVHPATMAQAIAFLRLLPSGMPSPDITASPSGEVSFHWSTGRTRVMSVAVSAAGRLTYAALVGDSRNFGSEPISDELPQSIAVSLQKVLGFK